MTDHASRTFVIEAGFFARRGLINEITSAAWEAGLECTHQRAGRATRFTVSGPSAMVAALLKAIGDALRERGATVT